jgi:hypothetical protein
MYARDLAAKYYENGYYPIPADVKEKMPRVSGFYDKYTFEGMWNNWLDCDIALVLNKLVCVDFDRHGGSPNGGDYYDMLMNKCPDIFKNSIIERSKSGGIHAYFKWTLDLYNQEWKLPVIMEGKQIIIEIKTGRRLAFCYPSKNYKLIQNSFEDMKLKNLGPLPTVFRYYKPAPQRQTINNKIKSEMTQDQREKAIDIIVDIYSRNAGIDGKMHSGAVGMGRYMAGLGYSANDITRAIRSYERCGHRAFRNDKEIDDIVNYSVSHAAGDAIPPWKHLKKVIA